MSITDPSILPLTSVPEVCFSPGVDEISVGGLQSIAKSPSSSEFMPDEEEAASTCPLLTPSPPVGATGEGLFPGMVYDDPIKTGDLDLEMTLVSTALNGTPGSGYIGPAATVESDIGPVNESCLQGVDDDQQVYINSTESVKSVHSSSSSSSAQEPNACVQLLNSHHQHHYQHLSKTNDIATFNCQENGVKKPLGIPLTLPRSSDDMFFINWNWQFIRKTCFWGAMSMLVGVFCVIVAMTVTMPRDCKPQNEWWQGTVIYEVFPASFRDSGHGGVGAGWGISRESKDGVGDLAGLTSRVNYIQSIGVQVLYLNAVLRTSGHYPEDHMQVASLTEIEPALGGSSDFAYLSRSLHRANISLLLDLPIYPLIPQLSEKGGNFSSLHAMSSDHKGILSWPITGQQVVTDALLHWMNLGVDGFYLKGLEGLADDPLLLPSLIKWRSVINTFKPSSVDSALDEHLVTPDKYRILVCSEEAAVSTIGQIERSGMHLEDVFDLVHVTLNMTDPEGLVSKVQRVLGAGGAFLSAPPKTLLHTGASDDPIVKESHQPWVMWSMGGSTSVPGGQRVASQLPSSHNGSLGALILQMMLPGSPCILYGDEIGMEDLHESDEERKELPWNVRHLGPMPWPHLARSHESKVPAGFTSPGVLPWLPIAPASALNLGPLLLSTMSHLRATAPSIYMSGVWKNGRYLPGFTIRHQDDAIIAVERSYPRLATYAVLANLGHEKERRDLSGTFYTGEVVAGAIVFGKAYPTGQRVSFESLMMNPGEALVVKLDK
ncbi:maltase 2-like [Hetaerina americana]|uniref:maltase 2-like n=1 Tax=Hetaerina americana TaxID=62018 RepID=UPI003A7F4EDE